MLKAVFEQISDGLPDEIFVRVLVEISGGFSEEFSGIIYERISEIFPVEFIKCFLYESLEEFQNQSLAKF